MDIARGGTHHGELAPPVRGLWFGLGLILLTGCGAQQIDPPVATQSLSPTLAAAGGQFPGLEVLPRPKVPVEDRRGPKTEVTVFPPRRPTAPTAPGVEPFTTAPLPEYEGPFLPTRNEPGVLIGELEGKGPLELYYRLAGDQKQIAPLPDDGLELVFQTDILGATLQSQILLKAKGSILLLYLTEGGPSPYRRTFEGLGLEIEQQPAEKDGPAPVRIAYGSQSFVLDRGQSRRIERDEESVVFFLEESASSKSKRAEYPPSYVKLLAFRVPR